MPKQPEKREPRPLGLPGADPSAHERKGSAPAALSLRGLLKAVFTDQLRLRREGPHLKIALESATPDTAPATLPPAPDPPAAPRQLMQRALGDLLESHAGSRSVLKHLAALEHLLKLRDDPFMHELSLSSLQHMLRQLHGLIAPPAPPGISLLQAELLDAAELKTRLEHERAGAGPQAISSFFVDHKLEVKELSPSTLEFPGLGPADK